MQDPTFEAPADVLQLLLEDVVERNTLDMDWTVRQLMTLSMVAVHTTSVTITNTLLDLYGHVDRTAFFVEGLREECEPVLAEHGNKWFKDAANKLIRVDSVIREALLITTFADYGLRRKVS